MKLLFVNACVRENSRTKQLCDFFLKSLGALGDLEIEELALQTQDLLPLDKDRLALRDACIAKGDFTHPMFRHAKQLLEADFILIGAPYWDFSFPALLKLYIESVCVNNLLFQYGENGIPYSFGKARGLLYLTTAGGYCGEYDLGWQYIRASNIFLGAQKLWVQTAEGLDLVGADVDALLATAQKQLQDCAEEVATLLF